MIYRYFYTLRPPAPGTQPEGFITRTGGLPKQDYYYDVGQTILAFGWVEYSQPLTFDQLWKYDLFPADVKEAAHFHFYLYAGRDEKGAQEYEQEYINANDDDIPKSLEWAVKTLRKGK